MGMCRMMTMIGLGAPARGLVYYLHGMWAQHEYALSRDHRQRLMTCTVIGQA
jgi:hypothetical protein